MNGLRCDICAAEVEENTKKMYKNSRQPCLGQVRKVLGNEEFFSCKWILLFIATYAYIGPLAFAERLREPDHMGIDGGES